MKLPKLAPTVIALLSLGVGFTGGRCSGVCPRPADAAPAEAPHLDPEDALVLSQLKDLQGLRALATARDLDEKERALLLELARALADGRDADAAKLAELCGGGSTPLPPTLETDLLRACRGSYSADVRVKLLELLVARVESDLVRPVAHDLVRSETDARVRAAAVRATALLAAPGDSSAELLARAAEDVEPRVRLLAVQGLIPLAPRDPSARQAALAAASSERDPAARRNMALAVRALDETRALEDLEPRGEPATGSGD